VASAMIRPTATSIRLVPVTKSRNPLSMEVPHRRVLASSRSAAGLLQGAAT
jgi:hypothetical protein